jgi:ppGpp synthetase/RelA/SpoT-type nucleotidyltranferase
MSNKLTEEIHKSQIAQYEAVHKHYETYAAALKRLFENACRVSFPEALVQSRAKTVSSFAEKVVRKFDKYPDPVHQFEDLCGARVIVQTAEQVRAVCRYIEANFRILKSEDKALLLKTDRFGYRDMHYNVRIPKPCPKALDLLPAEIDAIGDKTAEIQVRTWLEHAWADTLHDRVYKNDLKPSDEIVRTSNLLAALMEDGDRGLDKLADQVDGFVANYTAYASKEEVKKEIDIQQFIFNDEKDEARKLTLALKLARLLAACGDHDRAAALLGPFAELKDANRCELLLELGYNLCQSSRHNTSSPLYLQGIAHLRTAVDLCADNQVPFVQNPRRRKSLKARAFSRLGWALFAARPHREREVRDQFLKAHEVEPANPYYLSDMLGSELHFQGPRLPDAIRTTIREACRVCVEHAVSRIELPYAWFTAGRLSLLLKDSPDDEVRNSYAALGYYALGMRYVLAGVNCVASDILDEEERWICGISPGSDVPAESQRVLDLFALGRRAAGAPAAVNSITLQKPVLILGGGARSLSPERKGDVSKFLTDACTDFAGTIFSGGTTAGVPGCIGDLARELKAARRFRLLGFLPSRIPHNEQVHDAYDETFPFGDDFLPEQILHNWSWLLDAGVKPADVLVLGFGGGPLSAVEYAIALGLGAQVGLVADTGGAADRMLAEPLWSRLPNLYRLPFDNATVRAFVIGGGGDFEEARLVEMGKVFHTEYLAGSVKRLPPGMRPWDALDETFRQANFAQARYSIEILKAAKFVVDNLPAAGLVKEDFTNDEVNAMAELEHGRWNIDRMRAGWRYGKQRDDAQKIHDSLVSWKDLPDHIRDYDCTAVRAFPEVLAKVGLKIRRRS